MRRAAFALMILALLAGSASAGTIIGTVTDSTGAAVEGAFVTVRTGCDGQGGGPRSGMFRSVTDFEGNFMLNDVPEGTWDLHVAKRFLGMTTVQVEVPAEGEIRVDVQLAGCDGEGPGDGPGDGPGERPRHRWEHRNRTCID